MEKWVSGINLCKVERRNDCRARYLQYQTLFRVRHNFFCSLWMFLVIVIHSDQTVTVLKYIALAMSFLRITIKLLICMWLKEIDSKQY